MTLKENREELFEKELVRHTNGGRIYRKILEQDKEFLNKIDIKVLTNWKGQNEFLDWLWNESGFTEEEIKGEK